MGVDLYLVSNREGEMKEEADSREKFVKETRRKLEGMEISRGNKGTSLRETDTKVMKKYFLSLSNLTIYLHKGQMGMTLTAQSSRSS